MWGFVSKKKYEKLEKNYSILQEECFSQHKFYAERLDSFVIGLGEKERELQEALQEARDWKNKYEALKELMTREKENKG